jgi:hypothetical protein
VNRESDIMRVSNIAIDHVEKPDFTSDTIHERHT